MRTCRFEPELVTPNKETLSFMNEPESNDGSKPLDQVLLDIPTLNEEELFTLSKVSKAPRIPSGFEPTQVVNP